MRTITIVIRDLPKGAGATVITDAGAPAIGQQRSPAEDLAAKVLRICAAQGQGMQYGSASAALAGELVFARGDT